MFFNLGVEAMNWTRGFLRLWIVICIVWPLACIFVIGPPHKLGGGANFDLSNRAHIAFLLVPFLVVVVVGVVWRTSKWVYDGFVA